MERTSMTSNYQSNTHVQDTVEGMKNKVMERASDMGSALQSAPDGVSDLIRRYPIPALLIGLGVGFLVGRGLGMARTTSHTRSRAEIAASQAEAGFPDAMIQCLRCGEMVRQADMVQHSTVCSGTGRAGHGGSPA